MGFSVAFTGADHKVGTSQIAQSAAECLAKLAPETDVLLVHTETAAGDCFSPEIGLTMEDIRPYLEDCLLDTENIAERARYRDNLYIIGGAADPAETDKYFPDMTGFFIGAMKTRFGAVLCDCGADIDRGIALGALFAADSRVMILTQDESSVKRYEFFKPLYGKLGLEFDLHILNKYDKGLAATESYICSRLGLEAAPEKVRRSQFGTDAETDGRSLYSYKDGQFSKGIEALAALLAQESR